MAGGVEVADSWVDRLALLRSGAGDKITLANLTGFNTEARTLLGQHGYNTGVNMILRAALILPNLAPNHWGAPYQWQVTAFPRISSITTPRAIGRTIKMEEQDLCQNSTEWVVQHLRQKTTEAWQGIATEIALREEGWAD